MVSYDVSSPSAGVDPLALLSSSRRELLRYRIDLLAEQIGKRREIHGSILEGICTQDLSVGGEVLEAEAQQDFLRAQSIRLGPAQALQRERREELAKYFRDTSTLRDKLVEAVIAYKAAEQKDLFLSEMGRDDA